MSTPNPGGSGAVRDTGAVRDGRKKRFPLWLLLLLLLLVLAIIAAILIAALSGGSSKKAASVVPAAAPVTAGATPTTGSTDAAVPPPAAPTGGASAAAATNGAAANGATATSGATPTAAAASAMPTLAIKGGFVGGGTVRPVPAAGPFAAGDTLGTVLFAENSAELTPYAKTVIADAAKTIKTDALPSIVVSGYTDEIAGQPTNLTLSGKRAAAVLAALKADVGGDMTTYGTKDHGEQDPIATNDTADGRQQNRRATITTD